MEVLRRIEESGKYVEWSRWPAKVPNPSEENSDM